MAFKRVTKHYSFQTLLVRAIVNLNLKNKVKYLKGSFYSLWFNPSIIN